MRRQHITIRALTPESRAALGGRDIVPIDCFPFRIGRECRVDPGSRSRPSTERRGEHSPNNDLYLYDPGSVKYVSREHLQLERDSDGRFLARDRGSACGLVVGNASVGGDRCPASVPLEPDNVLIIGGRDSPYAFKFSVTYERDARVTPATERSPSASPSPA